MLKNGTMLFTRLLLTLLILGIDLAPILTELSGRIGLHDPRSYYADLAADGQGAPRRYDGPSARTRGRARTDRPGARHRMMSDSLFEARPGPPAWHVAGSTLRGRSAAIRSALTHISECLGITAATHPANHAPGRRDHGAIRSRRGTGRRRSPTGAGRAMRRRRTVPARQPVASRLHGSRSWHPPSASPASPGARARSLRRRLPATLARPPGPRLAASPGRRPPPGCARRPVRSKKPPGYFAAQRRGGARWTIPTVRAVGCWGAAGFCVACSPPRPGQRGACAPGQGHAGPGREGLVRGVSEGRAERGGRRRGSPPPSSSSSGCGMRSVRQASSASTSGRFSTTVMTAVSVTSPLRCTSRAACRSTARNTPRDAP